MASSISKFFTSFGILKKILLCCGCLLAWENIHADLDSNATPKLKKKPISTGNSLPTAIAETATAEVSRAGEVTLRLRGIARGGGQVEFRIQQKPRHGKIIRSKSAGLDSLDVVYRHSGDQSSDTDSFVFVVRASNLGPFSPGVVKIRIIDQPGRLMAPESLLFPATLVGQTASDNFVVLNEGGETLSGKISVTPPWMLKEAVAYNLAPGEKRKITVLFAPKASGEVNGSVFFEGIKPTSVDLRGEGLAPFQANPTKLILAPSLNGKRSGIVSLQNNTSQTLLIEIASQLHVPKSVSLQFGESKEITVEDDGIGLLNSFITFKSDEYTTRVDVSASEAVARTSPSVTAPTPSPASQASPPPSVASTPVPNIQIPDPVEAAPNPTPQPSTPASFITAEIVSLSSSAIRIDWSLPKVLPQARFSIQQRYLFLDNNKKLVNEWVEVPSAIINLSEKNGSATIEDLDADTVFTFRVQQISGENTSKVSSLPLVYKTEPNFFKRLTWRFFLIPLGVILLFTVIWKRWRKQTLLTEN